jgi:hypothetical protein
MLGSANYSNVIEKLFIGTTEIITLLGLGYEKDPRSSLRTSEVSMLYMDKFKEPDRLAPLPRLL